MPPSRLLLLAPLLLVVLASGRASAAAPRPAERNTCITCHQALAERLRLPAEAIPQDVHFARGVACQDCHGGDATSQDPGVAMSKAKGFVGKPTHQAIPALCGKCHSDADYMKRFNPALRVDQVQEYYTSVHGKRLRKGDQKVATCISCHDVHRIKAIKDQQAWTYPLKIVDTCGRCHGDARYMAGYSLPTDVVSKYKESVHYAALKGGDLSAPTCNVCHGNHGASPPGLDSVANVCGVCHSVPADMFGKSPHRAAFAAMSLPGCVSCHGNHDVKQTNDEMVGTGPAAVCANCHGPDSAGHQQAGQIRGQLDTLRGRLQRAEEILHRAERAGMEVSQAKFELRGAGDTLLKARASVHLADPAAVKILADEGVKIADRGHAKGVQALEDLAFRHKGLWISVGIICVTIVGLVLKIRDLDRRERE
jgi:hypothetical protein